MRSPVGVEAQPTERVVGGGADDHGEGVVPVADHLLVHGQRAVGGQGARHLGHLVAGQSGPASGGDQPGRPVPGRRRDGTGQPTGAPAHRAGQAPEAVVHPGHGPVAVVAPEQLVAAVAGQAHGHVLAGDPGDQHGGDLGGVGERLVVDGGQVGDHGLGLVGAEVHPRVVGAQVIGHDLGVVGLVEAGVGEPDGEGAHGGADSLHQGHHGRRVDAAGQERPHRHVGDHPGLDRTR